MKVTKAPGLLEYPYTIEVTEEEYQKQKENRIDPRLAVLKDYVPQDE